ncbi:hypothetical protein B0T20DRAFT_352825 [Sordaria brevicollis]|uniref:Uncharacterized protein n=1 Tax=Sordaria brevicollis TaxID=83679 RepID=A0AAE0PEB8_SORBR|nr:hypothetical protein B0T20DRAFT_352825 [Sordaria brevicollis]
MAFQPPTDPSAPFFHSSSLDNPHLGSAEPYDDSDPDLLGIPFLDPFGFLPNFSWETIDFNHSLYTAYPSSSCILGPTFQAAPSTAPIPVSAPAPALKLSHPSSQAYTSAHGIISDQAPDYHAFPNAGVAPTPCETIGLPGVIGVDAYSGLAQRLSGSGQENGVQAVPPGHRQPSSGSYRKIPDWSSVPKQPKASLNSAIPPQQQGLYGFFHAELGHSSPDINHTTELPNIQSSSQSWEPVGASEHGDWADHGDGSILIQGNVGEPPETESQWFSPQEALCDLATPIEEGYNDHNVDRESTGLDHSVGVQIPFDECRSLIPHSTSLTSESSNYPQTPPLSTNVTTPESTGDSGPPTPEPSVPSSVRKTQQATYQFVQYTAGRDTGDRTSKKRLTSNDDDQNGSVNIVAKDVWRDQEGAVKGFQIVFHHREKNTKKVRRTEEEKRPAANEPLFIKRKTVDLLANFSKPDFGIIKLKLTQKIGDHHLVVHEIRMPHYCLTHYDKVHGNILEYINLSKTAYLHTLKDQGGLTWEIVSMAMKYAETKKGSLVDTALDLWVICRMIEDPWELLEGNELGVSRVNLPGTKFHGKIPVPPMMDTQLDQVIIQFVLNHLRGKLIGLFEKNISPAKPETWFETFLASFIMLTHIERLAAHSVRHAETHTMPTKYSNTKFLEMTFGTAKIILSRFHYACNGSVPLRLNWKGSGVSSMAKIGPEEVEFMQRIQKAFKQREHEFRALSSQHAYETHGHWYHQLFIEDWDTSPVNVKDPYE